VPAVGTWTDGGRVRASVGQAPETVDPFPDTRTPRAPFRAHRGVADGCAPLECAATSRFTAPKDPSPGRISVGRVRARPSFDPGVLTPPQGRGERLQPSHHREVGAELASWMDLSILPPPARSRCVDPCDPLGVDSRLRIPMVRLAAGPSGVASTPEGISGRSSLPRCNEADDGRGPEGPFTSAFGVCHPSSVPARCRSSVPAGLSTVRTSGPDVQRSGERHRLSTGRAQEVPRIRPVGARSMRPPHLVELLGLEAKAAVQRTRYR
jgi:hypothetical protein